MFNEFELSDEQLAEVTGGSTRTNIDQIASSFTLQSNVVNAPTIAFANNSGKNGGATALAQGGNISVGNTAITLNGNSL
jgi:hypothetical protein